MATLADTTIRPIERDRLFFFVMSLAIAAVVVGGFSLQLVEGRSTFASPWWVHVHGVTFMGWLGIYLTQNWLVWRNDTLAHRKLGRIAAFYVGWMVLIGIGANTMAAVHHRIPPFFEPNTFLVMDWLTVLVFAGLTWAGVRFRERTDWHRRLMLCGAIQVMTPGVGRLLPLPLLTQTQQLWTIWACLVPFMAAAAIYDWRTRGHVHVAYAWGFGAITLAVAVMRPLAFTPPMLALTHYLTA
ncbi:MAG: hypothetical protein J0I47_02385 [Sphingomonas sp.]|uniref:hypothetical protein n=1 Tax=Sphingomonas sp. TaxID=28214 RepID=UPI001AD32C90|nr:hypothetical protein [Sphingomonas sp.]MBN8807077.1 hypothetical protein [Sphingomonas sp.]